jgi:hypothetical protein
MAWATAAKIINDALVEVGLDSAGADPLASTQPHVIQMVQLLKSVGKDLLRAPGTEWSHLRKTHSFVTAAGVQTYALPGDFRDMVQQSGWNRSARLPLGGPANPQEWAYLTNQLAGPVINIVFRFSGNGLIEVLPNPAPDLITVAFEYETAYWVAVDGSTSPTKYGPTLSTDVVLFDDLLATRALKVAFLRAKKFDYSSELEDYLKTLADVASEDSDSAVLQIGRVRGDGGGFLIGPGNVPGTGWGG